MTAQNPKTPKPLSDNIKIFIIIKMIDLEPEANSLYRDAYNKLMAANIIEILNKSILKF